MAGNKEREDVQNIRREVVDLYGFRERSKREVLEDIENAPPEGKLVTIRAYLTNINNTLIESSDTGKWFQEIRDLRNQLQEQSERYASLEFKIEGLDGFLGEVRERTVERMRIAHDERGNDWLWSDVDREAQEEYIDAAAFSLLLYRRLQLGGLRSSSVQTPSIEQEQTKPGDTSLESKLKGFNEFVESVRERIVQGDVKYGDQWFTEDQPKLIEEEVLDTFAYAYFGWRKAKILQSQQTSQPSE